MTDTTSNTRMSFSGLLRDELARMFRWPEGLDAWGVIIANAVTLGLALRLGWSLSTLLWPYWLQGVLVGAFTVWRMTRLRDVSRAGLKLPDQPMQPGAVRVMAWLIAGFFVLHFGLAHVVYLFFVYATTARDGAHGASAFWVLVSAAVFAGSQYLIARRQIARDREDPPALPAIMTLPYLRVVPMHLVIVLGTMLGGDAAAIVLFGALKIVAEVIGLRLEDRLTHALHAQTPGGARGTALHPRGEA